MIYRIDVQADDIEGSQTWEIEADSHKEALEKIWDGEIVEESFEVQRSIPPKITDVYEWGESNPPKSEEEPPNSTPSAEQQTHV